MNTSKCSFDFSFLPLLAEDSFWTFSNSSCFCFNIFSAVVEAACYLFDDLGKGKWGSKDGFFGGAGSVKVNSVDISITVDYYLESFSSNASMFSWGCFLVLPLPCWYFWDISFDILDFPCLVHFHLWISMSFSFGKFEYYFFVWQKRSKPVLLCPLPFKVTSYIWGLRLFVLFVARCLA